jgi:hypothetical protein
MRTANSMLPLLNVHWEIVEAIVKIGQGQHARGEGRIFTTVAQIF